MYNTRIYFFISFAESLGIVLQLDNLQFAIESERSTRWAGPVKIVCFSCSAAQICLSNVVESQLF